MKEYSKYRNYQEKHYSSTHDHSEARKRLAGSQPVHSGDVQYSFLLILRPGLSTSTVFSFTVGIRYYRRHEMTMAATIRWWNLACEIENKNYRDGVKDRDDKWKELAEIM